MCEFRADGQEPLDASPEHDESGVSGPLKWHGGKRYLASWIVSLMPRHLHYVEPFFGGGAVLFARDPDDPALFVGDKAHQRGVSEVVNDIDGRLMNFWRVLQDEGLFAKFSRIVQAVPLAHGQWDEAHGHNHDGSDPVADALAFFVDCRQSRAGTMKSFTSLTRSRTRRQMNGNASEWLSSVDRLPEVHRRLRRVVVENLPAVELIQREDTPQTLTYCDPPYLHETRTTTKAYAHEMTEQDHRDLLDVLRQCQGKVMLSGYGNALYDAVLRDWNRHTCEIANHAAGGATKRRMEEVLWCNF